MAGLLCVLQFSACRGTQVEPRLPPAWSSEVAAVALSRERCIDLALGSAPNRAAWDARIQIAHANLEQARLLPNPTLSLGWEDFGLNAAAGHNQVQTTLSLAMALEDLFARRRRGKIAEHELKMEEAGLRGEMARMASEVSRAHDRLIADRLRL
ncbi:MAG: TolC family protein, partial [Planctomycetota bacterium]